MLSLDSLSSLTGQRITSVRCQPLQAANAKSGSRLQVVETNEGQGPRFILKQTSLAWDWIMRATEDHLCRSVTLWQYGLFDRLPPETEHGVLACALDEQGWAILMQDVGPALLPYTRFSEAENAFFMEAMAALHATFFEAPELTDPRLNLCQPQHAYTMFSPATGYREIGGTDEIPQRILEGWELLPSLVEPDVTEVIQTLLADPQPLCEALSRYPSTLVHGDWRHANQGLRQEEQPRLILLDWQLAVVAPPALEIGRCMTTNSALLPVSKEATIELYRQQLARRLGDRFRESWWRPQLELGLLGGFLQDGWAVALKATHWYVGANAREHWQADLQWWSEQVRAGVRWLSLA
jgi:hypothetical protein